MKKLIIGIVAVIVLIIVAALVAPFLIPTETYKDRVIALVKQATGRDLTIGTVKFSLLPQLEIDASDVALAGAPGSSQPDMLRLKELEVRLRLLPLLHGTIELGRFVLTQPAIALEVDKAGHPNWAFAPAAPAPAPAQGAAAPKPGTPAPPATAKRPSSFSELRLENVQLVDGSIVYRDDRTGKVERLDAIAMKLSLPSLDSAFAGEGAAVWNGEKVVLSLGVAKPRALLGGAKSGLSMHITAKPVDLGFTGDATGLPPARLTGAVDLTVPSLRDFAKWVGASLPAGGGLGRLAIKGKLDMAGPKIGFSDAAIALDAITAQGALTLQTGGTRPAITGKLQVNKLDLNPYLPPEAAAKGAPAAAQPAGQAAPGTKAAPAPQTAGWSDAPLDLAALKAADADLDLTAGGIVYRKIVIGPSALQLQLKDGKLAVDLTQIALYQGKGQGQITLDGSGPVPALALKADLAGIAVGPLLEAAASFDRLSGTGKLSFDVAGSGKSQRALIGALDGKGALDLVNGRISGVNLVALAQNPTSAVSGAKDQGTDFGSLTGTFTITNGVVHNNDLQLKSGPVPVTGAGTVSLPARTVDYRLNVNLAGAVGLPVLVSGPWSKLSYRPDLSAIVRQPGKLLDTLKNLGSGGASNGASGSGKTQSPAGLLKGLLGR